MAARGSRSARPIALVRMSAAHRPPSRLLMSAIAATALLSAGSAAAQGGGCLTRKVVGDWSLNQSNGVHVEVRPQQSGDHIGGVAEYSAFNGASGKAGTIGGPIDGSISGDRVSFTVYWSNSTSGRYDGQIDANGAVHGVTVDRNDPGNRATFSTNGGSFQGCLVMAPPPPPPVALGRTQAPAKLATPPTGKGVRGEVAVGGSRAAGALQAPVRGRPPGRLPGQDPAAAAKAICDAAQAARARNSPLAADLEGRCAAAKAAAGAP